jgi:hypothetical protein
MYDSSKDKTLETVDIVEEGGDSGIELSICSYNEGEEKVQLTRWKTEKDGSRKHMKLGRMTIVESAAVADKIMEMATKRLVGA